MPFGRTAASSVARSKVRKLAFGAAGHPQMIHQVAAEDTVEFASPFGCCWVDELSRMRTDSSACAHKTTARPRSLHRARHAIDVANARRAAMIRVHHDLMDHRIGDQRAPAGRHRIRHRRQRRVEVRARLRSHARTVRSNGTRGGR